MPKPIRWVIDHPLSSVGMEAMKVFLEQNNITHYEIEIFDFSKIEGLATHQTAIAKTAITVYDHAAWMVVLLKYSDPWNGFADCWANREIRKAAWKTAIKNRP